MDQMDIRIRQVFTSLKSRFSQWVAEGAPKSLQSTLVLYFAIVVVVPLFLLGIITYSISSRTITRRVQTYVDQIIIKVKENIEYYFRDLQSLSYVISINPDVLTVLKDQNGLGGWREIGYQNRVKGFLAGLTSTRAEVKGIYVILAQQNRVYSSGPPVLIEYWRRQDWFKKIIKSEVGMVVTGVHPDNYSGILLGITGTVITYAQRIIDLDSQQDLGWVLIDLDYGFVTKMLANLQLWDQGRITILDGEGMLIYGERSAPAYYRHRRFQNLYLRDWGSYLYTIAGKRELISFQTVSLCGWKVIFSIPERVLQRENLFIRNFTVFLAIILLAVSIYLAVLFTRKIAGPIELLRTSMREIEKGNLNVSLNIHGMNEINELAASFNHMVAKIRGLMNSITEAEQKKKQAELNVLQAQINPHFLYNTLDSLRWLAKIRNVEEISEIISALENLLRASIGKTDQLITIGQELENVRNYLAIQLFRYGNGFTVEYQVNPQVLDYFTPRLILQPIVENAIYHGVEGVVQGKIQINIDTVESASAESELVRFEVIDNGRGIDEELARSIMAGKIDSNQRFSGIGIKNTDERIKLNFGPQYGVAIQKNGGQGTKVTVTIPRIRKYDKKYKPREQG
ncbi:MAG: sensor histidine kinase [Firmicutes bacterium]|nr:sensor histidine kinase [Bacillota bacterium]